jgi:hypothetical protein
MKQMKTVLGKILVFAVMLGTYTGYANETLDVESTSNTIKKGTHISISDYKGEVIYSERINHNGEIASFFDFTKLENGIYRVELNKDFEIEINAITVKDGVVRFLQDFKEKIFKPVFRSENSKVLISKIALDSDEMIIELYYENELIHSENIKGSEILNRVYQLDETLHGDYKAIIRSNNRVYIENFRI